MSRHLEYVADPKETSLSTGRNRRAKGVVHRVSSRGPSYSPPCREIGLGQNRVVKAANSCTEYEILASGAIPSGQAPGNGLAPVPTVASPTACRSAVTAGVGAKPLVLDAIWLEPLVTRKIASPTKSASATARAVRNRHH